MVLAGREIARAIISIVFLEGRMGQVRRSTGRVHIGRVKHDTIYLSIVVWKVSAIYPSKNIVGQ